MVVGLVDEWACALERGRARAGRPARPLQRRHQRGARRARAGVRRRADRRGRRPVPRSQRAGDPGRGLRRRARVQRRGAGGRPDAGRRTGDGTLIRRAQQAAQVSFRRRGDRMPRPPSPAAVAIACRGGVRHRSLSARRGGGTTARPGHNRSLGPPVPRLCGLRRLLGGSDVASDDQRLSKDKCTLSGQSRPRHRTPTGRNETRTGVNSRFFPVAHRSRAPAIHHRCRQQVLSSGRALAR